MAAQFAAQYASQFGSQFAGAPPFAAPRGGNIAGMGGMGSIAGVGGMGGMGGGLSGVGGVGGVGGVAAGRKLPGGRDRGHGKRLIPLHVPVTELVLCIEAMRYPIDTTVAGVGASAGTAASAASILAKVSKETLAASTSASIDVDGDADLLRFFLEAKFGRDGKGPETLSFFLAARKEKRLVVVLDGLDEAGPEYLDTIRQYVTNRLTAEVHSLMHSLSYTPLIHSSHTLLI
jgi:hypothetical protein